MKKTIFLLKKSVLKIFLCCMVLVCIVGCSSKERITYDFDSYLLGDDDFINNASTVMPSKENLINSNIIYYFYYDNGFKTDTFANRMIHLTVQYSFEEFINEKYRLDNQKLEYNVWRQNFYLDGILYNGIMFHNNSYCAFAYHICEGTKTINYIAFYTLELEFMDMASALKNFSKFEYDRVLPYLDN